jgi:SET domain-containing protein
MIIRSFRSPKVVTRISKISSNGAFAIERIVKDELIGIRGGEIVGYNEAMRRDREIGGYSMQITDDFFLCPRTSEEAQHLVLFINHSCSPNVGIFGQITFVAMKDIEPGSELTMDYAINVAHPYRLVCRCGSSNCRGEITGDDWRRPDLQQRYHGYFCTLIERKIKMLGVEKS